MNLLSLIPSEIVSLISFPCWFSLSLISLSLISWLIERIASSKQGKKIFVGENITKYQNRLDKEIKHIYELLSERI
jgi:hypothetical protein